MKITVIHNPYSNRWTSQKRSDELLEALAKTNLQVKYLVTQKPGDAAHIAAEEAAGGCQLIAAAGGDGTIGEVVNGIMQAPANARPILGIMPLGSANDLAANINFPTDLLQAARLIAEGKTRPIDLIRVNERYFINNAGLGLEPYTTAIQEEIKSIKGVMRYLAATVVSIIKNPQWEMRLEWDHGSYEGPVTMVSVSNGAQTGGLFYTVPHADPFDGKLSFVFGYIPTRIRIFGVLPRIMRPDEGNYIEHPAVHEIHGTWLRAKATPGTPAHADGELFDRDIRELEYKIFPNALRIITGD